MIKNYKKKINAVYLLNGKNQSNGFLPKTEKKFLIFP